MEKGKVGTLKGHNDGGTITDYQGGIINFTSSNFVGRNRSSLKAGDLVWFERICAGAGEEAINVRSC